jgi:hypothetical protein
MVVDRKHTNCHRFSLWDVINGGVVHTTLVLILLFLGKRTKLRKVTRLIAVKTRSSPEVIAPDELPCPTLACGIAIFKGFWFL